MTIDARMPRPGAANGVVPKNGIGIAFWIDGVPGIADMVKVEVPSAIAAGIRRLGIPAARNSASPIGAKHEERHEQAHAAIGDDGARQHNSEHRALRAKLVGHELRDGIHRPAVVHQFPEQRAQQEQRKELRNKAGGIAHERLGPARQQRLARESRSD